MYHLESMAHYPERVAKGRLGRRKSQRLPGRTEAQRAAFPFPAVLVGHLDSVVLVPSSSMGYSQAEVADGGDIASDLVSGQLPWRSRTPLKQQAESDLGARAS